MHTLPRNSTGHTPFLFFASFRRSRSALCHLLCEATCSLSTDKQLGNNVTNIQKLTVTTQQLGDRIMHIMRSFWGSCTFHVSNIIVDLRKLIYMIMLTNFLCWRSNFKNSCFGFHQVSIRSKTIKPLPNVSRVSLGVRTCEVFLCFVTIVGVRAIVLTSLFSLFYVTCGFHRFLHRGRARFSRLETWWNPRTRFWNIT